MPRRWKVLATVAMVPCFISGWLLQGELVAGGDVYRQARLFEEVLAHVRDYYVDSVAEPELYRKASDGLLSQLGDPYAALLTGKDLERHVERTTGDYAGIGLLVDARNGWVTVVTPMRDVSDLFLDPRQEILVSRGRAPGDNHRWSDYRPQRWPDLPVVVLVSGGTASAAEIIASALQDHGRALVVGDTTYGKGIVQSVFTLSPDLALRMTTARWYTPSGRSIQGAPLDSSIAALPTSRGLIPDVVLVQDTLTTAEATFAHSLGGQIPVFRDVLTAYALELRRGRSLGSEQFLVTAAMRAEVQRRLRDRGVAIADSVFGGAARIVDEQLGYEIARYTFGPMAERRRRLTDPPRVPPVAPGTRRCCRESSGSPAGSTAPAFARRRSSR